MSILRKKFGKSGPNLPLIGFGGASVSGEGAGYGFGDIDENQAVDLLRYAFEKGIELFDTAPIYGFGLSEKRIGRAFHDMRSRVFLVSKSGVDWHREGTQKGRVNRSNAKEVTSRMLKESLERLQTDYIDLYMIHWPDERVDIREAMEVLSEAKSEGLIRNIGLCNTNLIDLEKAKEVERVDAVQSSFNFFERDAQALFPYLNKEEIAFMSYGTYDKGILTGRVKKDRVFAPSDARSHAPWWKKSNWKKRVDVFEKIDLKYLSQCGMSGAEFALSFNLSFPEVSVCLCGCRSKNQVDSTVHSLKNLNYELAQEIDKEFGDALID